MTNKGHAEYKANSTSFNFTTPIVIFSNVKVKLGYEAGRRPKTPGRVKILFDNLSQKNAREKELILEKYAVHFPEIQFKRHQAVNSLILSNYGSKDLTVDLQQEFESQKHTVEIAMSVLKDILLKLIEIHPEKAPWLEKASRRI
jgi:hypothetical protein